MTIPKVPDKSLLQIVPVPTATEILEQRRQKLEADGVDVTNWTPSDPVQRNQSAASYRENLVRKAVNDQAFSVLLPWASGNWLDYLGNTFYRNLPRLTGESDDAYRLRLQESPEFWSQAGATGKYYTVAKAVSTDIKELAWYEVPDKPCEAIIYVLTHSGDGTPSQALLDSIRQAVMEDGVKWNTDVIATASADLLVFSVNAELEFYTTDPDKRTAIIAQADKSLSDYLASEHKFGGQVVVSGLHKALKVDGVVDVHLIDFAPVKATPYQVPSCNAKTITARQ